MTARRIVINPAVIRDLCGTKAGYARHLYYSEETCKECRKAINADRPRLKRTKPPKTRPQCGTRKGYNNHLVKKELPCQSCKDFINAVNRSKTRIHEGICGNALCSKKFQFKQSGGLGRKFCSPRCKRQSENGSKLRTLKFKLQQFGMTVEEWDKTVEQQRGKCLICRRDETSKRRSRLTVDHCHETNTFRGAICHSCNVMLGLCDENFIILQRAMKYLILHANKVKSSKRMFSIDTSMENDPLE